MSLLNKTKHWIRDLTRYPVYRPMDASYDRYWERRDMDAPLNSFQRRRVSRIVDWIRPGESVVDVGCGDGRILAAIKSCVGGAGVFLGVDSSDAALAKAEQRGLNVFKGSIADASTMPALDRFDWVLLLEVIEHFPDSERLLEWAFAHADTGVIFSVPNTGFIMHRLRLLLGKFPLQWRSHPSEHVRFWTLSDMHKWLVSLGYRYKLDAYEGVPGLNRWWPALFAEGLIVRLSISR